MTQAGKGSKWRKTNYKKFYKNFDEIDFSKKQDKNKEKKESKKITA